MNDFFKARSLIIKTVSEGGERHHLCMEDINALARLLAYKLKNDDDRQYETVVDYLWMSLRIEFNTKMLLLNLLDEHLEPSHE